jgi:hypothetical protein
MWHALLLGGVLAVGQGPPPEREKPTLEEPAPAAAAPAERWPLMTLLQGTSYGWLLDDHKVRVYGWTEVSFTASSDRHDQLPMGFNYLANNFLLQQNWLRIERLIDTKATEPNFGFRLDTILPGADYRFTIARGLFDGQFPATYGIDPVQFYAEAYFPQVCRGLTFRVGKFFTQYGIESIDATQDLLVSHVYSFIYDPFTNTGAMAQVQLDDAWSVQSGLVLGGDIFIHPADTPTYIGSVKWAPPKGRASVQFAVILGDPRFDPRWNFNHPQILDLVFTYKLSERVGYSLDSLYGYQAEVPGIGFANWFSVVQYLTCQLDPQLSGTVRLELFDDVQGQRTGFPGLYTALTAGLNYKPRPEVVLRPEVRYDYNEQSRPFEGKKGVFTMAMDMILRW